VAEAISHCQRRVRADYVRFFANARAPATSLIALAKTLRAVSEREGALTSHFLPPASRGGGSFLPFERLVFSLRGPLHNLYI